MKNVLPLAGKPLMAWPIAAAIGSRFVDRTIVSTDDQGFADIAISHGAEVPFLRPAELASDTAPSIGFVLHALEALDVQGEHYDYVVLVEPTSPLTDAGDIDAALTLLEASPAEAIVGISKLEATHPAFAVRKSDDGTITPYTSSTFGDLPRRQDIEPLYTLDGTLYISTVDALRRERSFCHQATVGYESARHKALEIDDLVDFICIEAIANNLDRILNQDRTSPSDVE